LFHKSTKKVFNIRLNTGGTPKGNSNLNGVSSFFLAAALILQIFTANAFASFPPAALTVTITGQTSFCPGSTSSLVANVSGCNNSASYVWRRNGVFMPGATTGTISVSNPGIYTVTVNCGSNNATSSEFNLKSLTLKTNVQNACPGSVGNVNLMVSNGKEPITYNWNTGATTQDLIGVPSGNYSVSVKDADGCIATTIATVNNTPVNVSAGAAKEICAGGSASLQASGADLYFWSPSTGLSSTVESNTIASPASTTLYTVTGYIASGELVTNGTFNQGNTGFNSEYAYVAGLASGNYSTGTGLYPEGKYSVVSNRTDSSVTKYHPSFVGFGHNKGNAAGRNDDRYMAVNGSTTLDQAVWKQSVEVIPGNKYSFSCWITSLLTGNPSKLRFLINGVEIGPRIEAPSTLYTWKQFFTEWNSGSATVANIAIINDNLVAGGNDFGLDDISFSTTCTNTSTVLVTVVPALSGNTITCPANTTFCLSGDAGIITGSTPTGGNGNYAYQWQVSVDNTNWSDVDGATSASYDPGTVFSTTRFRRIAKSSSCSIESNVCTITITAGNTIYNNSITAPGTSTFCNSGDPSSISGSTPFGGGSGVFVYTWLSSNDGNEYTEIAGAKSASYDPGVLTETTHFRRVVSKGNCNSNASNVIVITVNKTPVVSLVSAASICGSGRGSLEVSSAGATFKWFETSTSTTVLGTGAVYTTPALTGSATYYAQATLNNCSSDRFAVTATVKTLPTVVSTTGGSTCGIGNVTVSAVPSAGNIVWYSSLTEGAILGTENSLNLSQVSFNSTVYAEAQNDGCISTQRSAASVEIKNPTSSETTLSACVSQDWNGVTYTASGDYEKHFTNAAGCDSTATLHLTIKKATSSETTLSACVSQDWNGETYTASGDYEKHFTNAAGCDSTATLHLTIKKATSSETTLSACGSQSWNGETYTASGDYVKHFDNAAGCDSTATLHLTIKNATSSETTLSACGSQSWNGETYTASGDYVKHFDNAAGCDSTATLHLTIKKATSSETTLSACGSQSWNGVTYTASGDYVKHFNNAAGCDSTATLHLTIKKATSYAFSASINSGASYSFFGQSLTTAGEFTKTILNKAGCDSVITLTLSVTPVQGCNSIYAEEVVGFRQGKMNNGAVISAARSNPGLALGAPQNNDTQNFVSLGFGGEITLKFCKAIKNGPGNDVKVTETTFGGTFTCANNPEKIRAFGSQDGCRFVYIGEGCQDSEFDLGSLPWIQYIRLVDVSPLTGSKFAGLTIGDAYDVDGVTALNGIELNPVASPFAPGANRVISYNPGKCKNGNNIPTERSNASKSLGLPQKTDVVNFVSLGFGGSLTLKFDYLVVNNPSAGDLQVVETSFGNPTCNAYPEKAMFEASLDGNTWTNLGELCQDGTLELGTLPYIHMLRITDVSDKSKFPAAGDAYDVDGVVAINQPCGNNSRMSIADMIEDDNNTPDEGVTGTIFPNPAKEKATLQLNGSQENESWNIRIIDMTGKVISESVFEATAGSSEFPMDVTSLPRGIFQVIATNGQTKLALKLNH
jgi:Ig-like domain CHU_C associated/Secretion system C-terminal sorting domain